MNPVNCSNDPISTPDAAVDHNLNTVKKKTDWLTAHETKSLLLAQELLAMISLVLLHRGRRATFVPWSVYCSGHVV